MAKKNKCEICGYEGHPLVVFARPDGIFRCQVCVWRAYAPGESYVNEEMAHELHKAGFVPDFLKPDDPLREEE